MANITTADVKRLREITGAGMMDCKKALEEAAGDLEKAIETLRVKGAKDVGKRESRTASNGLVTAVLDDARSGVLLELNCETDFVAKTEAFQTLAAEVAATIATAKPSDVDELQAIPLPDKGARTIRQLLDEANAALGEKVEVRRFASFDDGYIAAYLHRTSPGLPPAVGVLVELDGPDAELAKDLTHHIAAMAPRYVRREDVPAEVVENERRIAEQAAREQGKPEPALAKIVEGRLNGFFKDFVLPDQAFVKDNKRTIGQLLDGAGVAVKRFARFKVGQG